MKHLARLLFLTVCFMGIAAGQRAEPVSDLEQIIETQDERMPWSFEEFGAGGWSFITDYPGLQNGLYGGSVYVVVNDTARVMVFGGYNNVTVTGTNDVWSWNTVTNVWTQKASMPSSRFYHHVAAVAGKVYIISGAGPSGATAPVDSTLEYDPVTDTYAVKAPIPIARNWGGVGVWNNRLIYIVGGSTTGTAAYINDTYVYEPQSDTWAPVTNSGSVFTPRRSHSVSVVNGPDSSFLVVAGGFGTAPTFKPDAYEARIDTNDFLSLQWAQVPNMPIVGGSGTFNGMSRTAGAAYDRYHLVIGGEMSFTPADTVFRYSKQVHGWNTASKTWTRFLDKNFGSSNMIFNAHSPLGEVWQIGAYGTPSGSVAGAAGTQVSEWTNSVSTDVEEQTGITPATFLIEQNYPNPFNPSTTIRYALPRAAYVSLKVYNVLGQEIAALVNDNRPGGTFTAVWNGRSDSGSEMGSGVYFCRLDARTDGSTFSTTRKMLLVK
jgi:hypothetical protein